MNYISVDKTFSNAYFKALNSLSKPFQVFFSRGEFILEEIIKFKKKIHFVIHIYMYPLMIMLDQK